MLDHDLDASPTQEDLTSALAYFWHPVCTEDELAGADGGVLGVRLLGRELVVADLGGGRLACLVDRCPHRSTRLSAGWVEHGTLRCAYHGWRFAADGRCVEIPSAPGIPVPPLACQSSYSVERHHGLVWVRLDDRAGLVVPPCPAVVDPAMKALAGPPYTWPVAAGRRVENFTDLSHFAWVHDGSLGRRDQPVPPVPELRRCDGALWFEYQSPELAAGDDVALIGESAYRLTLPFTVDIHFDIAGRPGVQRRLWMTASPLDERSCRTFWFVARSDDHDGDDARVLAFQDQILAEDAPVVCSQDPEFPLAQAAELSVRADRVSIEYRRWLREVVVASRHGPAAVRLAIA